MASQDRGTQTDGYELLINGTSSPPEFITKDGFNYKFKCQSQRMAFYLCTYSACKNMAYLNKHNGLLLSRGTHDHKQEPFKMVAMLKDLNTYNNLFILRLKRYIINHLSRISFPSIKLTPFIQNFPIYLAYHKITNKYTFCTGAFHFPLSKLII